VLARFQWNSTFQALDPDCTLALEPSKSKEGGGKLVVKSFGFKKFVSTIAVATASASFGSANTWLCFHWLHGSMLIQKVAKLCCVLKSSMISSEATIFSIATQGAGQSVENSEVDFLSSFMASGYALGKSFQGMEIHGIMKANSPLQMHLQASTSLNANNKQFLQTDIGHWTWPFGSGLWHDSHVFQGDKRSLSDSLEKSNLLTSIMQWK